MADTFVPVTGFGGDATIGTGSTGSYTFPVIGWSLRNPATILSYYNSKSGNHPERASTYTDAMVTIEIDFQLSDQPFQTAVNILPGDKITNVNLIISADSGDAWTITQMIVSDMPQSLQRAGKVVTSINAQIRGGTITAPGNSTPY